VQSNSKITIYITVPDMPACIISPILYFGNITDFFIFLVYIATCINVSKLSSLTNHVPRITYRVISIANQILSQTASLG